MTPLEDSLFQLIVDYMSTQTKDTLPNVRMSEELLTIITEDDKYIINPDTLECTQSTSQGTYIISGLEIAHLLRPTKKQQPPQPSTPKTVTQQDTPIQMTEERIAPSNVFGR